MDAKLEVCSPNEASLFEAQWVRALCSMAKVSAPIWEAFCSIERSFASWSIGYYRTDHEIHEFSISFATALTRDLPVGAFNLSLEVLMVPPAIARIRSTSRLREPLPGWNGDDLVISDISGYTPTVPWLCPEWSIGAWDILGHSPLSTATPPQGVSPEFRHLFTPLHFWNFQNSASCQSMVEHFGTV